MEVAIAVLIGIIIYQGVIHQLDKREAVRRESELLNRIMAKSYEEYVMAEARKEEAAKPTEPAPDVEFGIPV